MGRETAATCTRYERSAVAEFAAEWGGGAASGAGADFAAGAGGGDGGATTSSLIDGASVDAFVVTATASCAEPGIGLFADVAEAVGGVSTVSAALAAECRPSEYPKPKQVPLITAVAKKMAVNLPAPTIISGGWWLRSSFAS